jgi:hypothetical protein
VVGDREIVGGQGAVSVVPGRVRKHASPEPITTSRAIPESVVVMDSGLLAALGPGMTK